MVLYLFFHIKRKYLGVATMGLLGYLFYFLSTIKRPKQDKFSLTFFYFIAPTFNFKYRASTATSPDSC